MDLWSFSTPALNNVCDLSMYIIHPSFSKNWALWKTRFLQNAIRNANEHGISGSTWATPCVQDISVAEPKLSFSPRIRPSMSNLHFNSKHCPSQVSRRKQRLNFCCAANFKSPQKLPWPSFVLGFIRLFWNSSFYLLFIPFSRIRTTSQPSWTIWLEVSSFSTWFNSIFKDWVYRNQQIDVHIGPSQRTIPTTQSSSATETIMPSPSFNLSVFIQ